MTTGRGADRALGAVSLTIVLPMLAACAGAEPEGEALVIDFATYEPTGTGGDSALLEGTLADRGGCLVIEDATGGDVLPVWPSNRVSASSTGGLRLMGADYELGDTIAVGGGFAERLEAKIPESCTALALQLFLVSQG